MSILFKMWNYHMCCIQRDASVAFNEFTNTKFSWPIGNNGQSVKRTFPVDANFEWNIWLLWLRCTCFLQTFYWNLLCCYIESLQYKRSKRLLGHLFILWTQPNCTAIHCGWCYSSGWCYIVGDVTVSMLISRIVVIDAVATAIAVLVLVLIAIVVCVHIASVIITRICRIGF